MKRQFRFLAGLMSGEIPRFFIAILCMVAASLLLAAIPQITQLYVDTVIDGSVPELPFYLRWLSEDMLVVLRERYWLLGLAIPAAGIVYLLFAALNSYLTMKVGENVSKRTREQVYGHLLLLPASYFRKMSAGALIQRCSSDIDEIQMLLSRYLIDILRSVVLVVAYLAVMLSIDGVMTAVALILVPVLVVFGLVFYKKTRYSYTEYKEAEDGLAEYLTNYIQGVRVVKAFGMQELEREAFGARNEKSRDKLYQREYVKSWYWPYYMALLLLQTALILIIGIIRIVHDQTTVGVLIAFSSYSALLFTALGSLGRHGTFLIFAEVAVGRLNDILGAEVEHADGTEATLSGDIVFDRVSVHAGDTPILKNVSFTVGEGRTTGILGTTGSGKSALVQVLLRMLDYDGGSVRIGGKELSGISRFAARRQIAAVLQEPFLFSRTVRENLALGTDVESEDLLIAAAKCARIHEDITGFPEGYDTVIGEKGTTVSGGQKQRLAIAQALCRKCGILVMDDSLSAVDAETEQAIWEELSKTKKGRTVLIISNRISVLQRCDLVLCLDDGRITEAGTPQELADGSGLYARILALQAEGGE